ncbi:universal stress protein [Stenotrophomonas sp. Marseille-Q4652]|uniref:universal stress protein n=1 Tax=Stenotrophomonas sp. Marseille-Q4652 TaxID=2866595 RepID=UPI001CE3D6F9|nr:universal stress protein [Stenotrophomonas sp. Marseille-Q4652]
MNPDTLASPPHAVLLATDLSARCDRALDRALLLARQWQARLVVATVVENDPGQSLVDGVLGTSENQRPSARQLAERRLLRDLGELQDPPPLTVRVERGQVGRTLLEVAREEGCGLIVTGLARDTLFEPQVLGSSVAWLARNAGIPLLVVHGRARAPYRGIAVASDFSDAARHALQAAQRLFGPAPLLSLVHGVHVPKAGLLSAGRDAALDAACDKARSQARAWLRDCGLDPAQAEAAPLVVQPGDPARLVRDHARDHPVDLVVVGSQGRGALSEILLGSVANRVLETGETDTLLVQQRPA